MNKGLELIEAVWLFGLPPEKVQVVVQRQSCLLYTSSSAGTRPGGGRCGLLCAGHGPVFISETVYGTGGAAPGDAAHPDLHRDLPNAGASAADIVKRRGLLYDKAIYRANAAGKHPAPVFIAGARAYTWSAPCHRGFSPRAGSAAGARQLLVHLSLIHI